MKRCALILSLFCATQAQAAEPQRVDVAQFGPSLLYKTEVNPSLGFIALVSPSTGWDSNAAQTAKHLAQDGYVVLGLDAKAYAKDRKASKDKCLFPSGLIEDSAHSLQKSADHTAFHRPMVIGLGDSGLLAATAMLQSLPGTYRAAIAPAFCPVTALPKPLCSGERLKQQKKAYRLTGADVVKPDEGLYLVQDPACKTPATTWPTVAAQKDVQSFIDASLLANRSSKQSGALDGLDDLPLTYLPADGNDWLVILVSGDGGWRDIDRQLGEKMQKAGYAVVGLDSLRYFWNEKTPSETAVVMDRIVTQAQKFWHKRRIALVGYSFGADILPFTVSEMRTGSMVQHMTLLGFTRHALFEITAGSFLGVGDKRYDNVEALAKMPRKVPTLCVYGKDETDPEEDDDSQTLCPKLHQPWIEPLMLSGGHHFDGDYDALTQRILDRLGKAKSGS